MDNQQNAAQAPSFPATKAELLERIRRSRAALEATLNTLSEAEMTRPGPSGWSIKDHLAHLAAWELGIAALLTGRPRFTAMQVEDAAAAGQSVDELNELIYRLNAGLSLAEVRDNYQAAHRQMLAALGPLDDADLQRPYVSFLPARSDGPDRPVIEWIVGDTYDHFDEHNAYIRAQLQEIRGGRL
jgi:hypothetical protein